ncbi:MAG: ABC transporter ATP-binding protein [Desulfobacteraceae bacterium]|nr:MAG: ABC transporter ATP-binding protein [Desulfobacteraceae bacterium]
MIEQKGGPILKTEGLSKSFAGLMAVRKVGFTVDQGEILGLIGPNGSGKTTLFNLISGFLRPDGGRVEFRGKEITGLKPHRICEAGIVRTFQLVKPFAEMTALQNVVAGRTYGSKPIRSLKQARTEAEEILAFTGLSGKKSVPAGQLGLADRKRLEIARALATKPDLLLLDESMCGLNPVETEDAIRLIREIRSSGITVIIVEHVMKVVIGISDRIVVMNAGEKIAEGKPLEITTNKTVIAAYLGKRYAER